MSCRLGTVLGILLAGCFLCPPAAAGGQALALEHPVYGPAVNRTSPQQYIDRVNKVMQMSDDELLSYVPDRPHNTFCECPNCYGGSEGFGVFAWKADHPTQITCRFCDTVFPNERLPEDKVLEGVNPLGETVRFEYYENPANGVRHFLSSHLRMHRTDWLMQQVVALGEAYQATGDDQYAARVALVLDRLAQVYPHYPVVRDTTRAFEFRASQQPPYHWDSGRWGHFHNEIPKPVIRAYDLTCESPAWDELSAARGYDTRERLENDFLKATFEAVAAKPDHIYNVVGYDVAGAAILGRVINEPRYVHWAYGWMVANVMAGCFYDGCWHEATSYHYMTMGGLKSSFDTVRGYSDPPGYVDPVDGTRLDNVDPETQLPFYAKALRAPAAIDFPNGWSPPVHDSHPYERHSEQRTRTVSAILPGFGDVSLGRGEGANQMQALLHFSGNYGHHHLDSLNLGLWAKGREMLPDIGYTWTPMRPWATTTLSHNTVVVDRTPQGGSPGDGNLLCFVPDAGGLNMVEADGTASYQTVKGVDLYRRMLVTLPVGDTEAYVFDAFWCRGGSRHEWALHGDAESDQTVTCSLPLAGRRDNLLEEGDVWKMPETESDRYSPYGLVRDVSTASVDGPFDLAFEYDEGEPAGLRLHMASGGPAELLVGRSPSVRRVGQGASGDSRKIFDYWMPQVIVRREAEGPLASMFVAVEEPYEGKPFLGSVRPVELSPPDPNAAAVEITHDGAVDTIIVTLDEAPYPTRRTSTGIEFSGRLGVVRLRDGKPEGMWMVDGTRMTGDDWGIESPAEAPAGEITGAERKMDGAAEDAFVTGADLPLGEALRGKWMIVTHGNGSTHGYEIARVDDFGDQRRIVLTGEHGLRIDGETTTQVFFPQKKIAGVNTFRVPVVTALTGMK